MMADDPGTVAKLLSLNEQFTELYRAGKSNEAISVVEESLELSEKTLGPDHPATAQALSNLAALYYSMGDYAKAEPLFQRALEIREKALGPDHPDTAITLNSLAVLRSSLGDYAKAEPLFQRALAIDEKALGPDDPEARFFANLIHTFGATYTTSMTTNASRVLRRCP
jgi:tetratricopeptide (TPR) repeat protein